MSKARDPNRSLGNSAAAPAIPSKPQLLLLLLLAGAVYAIAAGINGNLSRSLWPVGFGAEQVPLFWFAAAYNEAILMWLIVRNFKVTYAITFVLLLSFLESLWYAMVSEDFWTGMIIGTMFGRTLLVRFILNGHLFFFFTAYATTRITNLALPNLKWTGSTINLLGLLASGLVHFYWNYLLALRWMDWFGSLACFLASVMIVMIYFGTPYLEGILEPTDAARRARPLVLRHSMRLRR